MSGLSLASRVRTALTPNRPWLWITVLIVLIAGSYALRESGRIAVKNHWKNFHERHQPRPIVPSDIRGWMTFEYLNTVFHLPPTYLSETLHIETKTYPRTTLKQEAKNQNLPLDDFIQSAGEAISRFPQ
ncbi:MAG: hypothetical protein ACEQSB_03065 [Undibacterium sp.]